MKRSRLGPGQKSLERGSTFKARGKPLRRRARRAIDRQASEAWAKGVRGKRCVVCGATGKVQGHHVIPQQHLRHVARERNLDLQSLLWDRRNRLPVCERCHQAHHNASRRISLDVVLRHAPKAAQFARELGLSWRLGAEYSSG